MIASEEIVLGVQKSALDQAWIHRLDREAANLALAISQKHDIPEMIGRVLAGRGVELDGAKAFLDPNLKSLMPDPSVLMDMDHLAERLAAAIRNREKIALFGDYDVDGATSCALMGRFLQHFGLSPDIHIPDRIIEGYGPNGEAMANFKRDGASLVICLDCGSSGHDAIARANALDLDVLVIDHHQVGEELPQARALVNPNRQDDLSGLGYLCAAGVTFMVLVALNRLLRTSGYFEKQGLRPPDLLSWLDLVALGTVCDVVPLKGLNRGFVVKGLIAARMLSNKGLEALAQVSRISGPIDVYHLGFLLGPRINAGGRIGDSGLGVRLLMTSDNAEAGEIAANLNQLNNERQVMEADMLAVAEASLAFKDETAPVIVTGSKDWHPGIVGLLASRMKERYKKPAFAISYTDDVGTGSGRSIPGVDLGALVRRAVETGLLKKGGGHAMAAGITIEKQNEERFQAFLEDETRETVAHAQANSSLKLDGAITASGATADLVSMLERAGPYGAAHPEPLFVFPAHTIRSVGVFGSGHMRLTLRSGDGSSVQAVTFRADDTPMGKLIRENEGKPLHVAGHIAFNTFRGTRSVQVRIRDVARVS